MKKLLLGAMALVLLGACSKKNVEIAGDIKGLADTKAVLNKLDGGRPTPIDTVEVKGGKFKFELAKTDALLYIVTLEGHQEPIAFFGGDDDVTINGASAELSKVKAEGGEMTKLFDKFNNEIPKVERSKALRGDYMKAQMAGDTATMMSLRSEYENISTEQKAYFDKFLADNMNNSVGAFIALNMAMGMEPAKVKEMFAKFEKALPNHPYIAEMKKMQQAMEQMQQMQMQQQMNAAAGQGGEAAAAPQGQK
jgi:hypothetical protein